MGQNYDEFRYAGGIILDGPSIELNMPLALAAQSIVLSEELRVRWSEGRSKFNGPIEVPCP